MFIRKAHTRSKNAQDSDSYFTFRLVTSERQANRVRQITLLNLGRYFDLPSCDWPRLCRRIDALLAGQQVDLFPEPDAIETLAQRCVARLIAGESNLLPAKAESAPAAVQPAPLQPASLPVTSDAIYAEVDLTSLQLTRPRSVGVEAVGLAAMKWLDIDRILSDLGLNAVQRHAVAGLLIGRMAAPGSELATLRWLRERSALGELLDTDFEAAPLIRLYRTSDLLVRHRDKIESVLFSKIQDLFDFPATVTLYDLTNTYFEGSALGNEKAARGRSKEKRSDCPLVTLGLVLDGSGFVRRSKMFAGHVSEGKTLPDMLAQLGTPRGAMIVMDAGIATADNIAWLTQQGYRYLVASRERMRQFDPETATSILAASGDTIQVQRVLSKDGTEVRLYCHSPGRKAKESAITERFVTRFEAGLTKLAASLTKPRAQTKLADVHMRIGRLKEKSRGISQHYEIIVTPDETGQKAASIVWAKTPVEGSKFTHPGICCLRSNETSWSEETIWRTYTMLTDLESVFRGLKSELGLRPVYHQTPDRVEGHLLITVLAYQLVQTIRRKLEIAGVSMSWARLREVLSVQHRVTATFLTRNGQTRHVRKTTTAEPPLRRIYDALALDAAPGGVQTFTV
jgi:Transposase DDE domain